jgi:hypothetical protein
MTVVFLLLTLFYSHADLMTPYQNKKLISFPAGNTSVTFPQTYEEARTNFREIAGEVIPIRPKSQLGKFQIKNKKNDDLSIDYLYIPFEKSKKLLILTSGIHGAEAFAGNTIELSFLRRFIMEPANYPFNILIIHSLNPYGFKNFRRANENNVDLNRNFAEPSDFASDNKYYTKLRYLFNPQGTANTKWTMQGKFYFKSILAFLINGKKTLLRALSGQYNDPTGPFYGGNSLQPETADIQLLITKYASYMDEIYHVDLHTGFGEKNRLNFIGTAVPNNPEARAALRKMFYTYQVVNGQDKNFYPTTGDLITWTLKAFPEKVVIPMTFEFGTMDSQTILGGLTSLWITAVENQGHQHGYALDEDQSNVRDSFELLFNPQDEAWQRAVMTQSEEALTTTLKRFQAL